MGKIAFVFAGQGSQYPGMGKELYSASEAAKNVFDTAENIRKGTLDMCFEGSAEELGITVNTQPCLFAFDLAAARALEEAGVKADGAAGFSLGEIPALTFAGAFTDEDGFKLVCKRAEFMQEASEKNKGKMAAVLRMDDGDVEELCAKIGDVYPVNYNCKGQLVCAGKSEAVDELSAKAAEAGGRAVALAVSGAFHCPFMDSAADKMESFVENANYTAPKIPVYANYTAKPYDSAELVCRQINNPVRWRETVENMIVDGFDTFIEVGAGKTLSGLIKKISRECRILNVQTSEDVAAVVHALK